jgi:hypothetical protein
MNDEGIRDTGIVAGGDPARGLDLTPPVSFAGTSAANMAVQGSIPTSSARIVSHAFHRH